MEARHDDDRKDGGHDGRQEQETSKLLGLGVPIRLVLHTPPHYDSWGIAFNVRMSKFLAVVLHRVNVASRRNNRAVALYTKVPDALPERALADVRHLVLIRVAD
ncbi:hypothetical protein G6F24_015950 [Rhizopus arrhizus]|nr:hypothetical protein G6F24_015950 [Rhizopus arrhizus]